MNFKFLSLTLIFTAFNFNFLNSFILNNATKTAVSGVITKHISGTPMYSRVKFELDPNDKIEVTLTLSDAIAIYTEIPEDIKAFYSVGYTKDQLNSNDLIFSFIERDKKIEIVANKTPDEIKKEEQKKEETKKD